MPVTHAGGGLSDGQPLMRLAESLFISEDAVEPKVTRAAASTRAVVPAMATMPSVETRTVSCGEKAIFLGMNVTAAIAV